MRAVKLVKNQRDELSHGQVKGKGKQLQGKSRKSEVCQTALALLMTLCFLFCLGHQIVDSPDCEGRKHLPHLSGTIVCDDQKLFWCHVAGWTGFAHDTNTRLHVNKCFNKNQCVMGDSAFENLWHMLSAFTAQPGQKQCKMDHCAFDLQLFKVCAMIFGGCIHSKDNHREQSKAFHFVLMLVS